MSAPASSSQVAAQSAAGTAAPASAAAPARAAPAPAPAAGTDSDDDAPALAHDDEEPMDDWSSSDEEDDGEGDEEEPDAPSLCLFCSATLPTLAELRAHLSAAHAGFNFRQVAQQLQLDFYGQLKLINWTREKMAAAGEPAALVSLLQGARASAPPAELTFLFDGSDSYLKPFLHDDSLLFSLPRHDRQPDEEADDEDGEEVAAQTGDAASSAPTLPQLSSLLRENQSLRNELESMAESMATMQAALKRVAFPDEEESEEKAPALATGSASASSSAAPSAAALAALQASAAGGNPGSFAPDHVDRDYFGGYSVRRIHELMLRDKVRTEAYRDFMLNNPQLFKDKVVLDVGCGTGILSLFAAKAGAKRVIAVDAADIVVKAREIIAANGYADRIEVLHGKMEEVTLPVDKVDIIISEWMGYFLLFESMLPSVLYARDRYLSATPSASQPIEQATGVYPDQAIMYVSAIETQRSRENRIDWWSNVYGFDMSCLVDESERYQGSSVEIIRPGQQMSDRVLLQQFDCNTVQDRQLDFTSSFTLTIGAHAASAGGKRPPVSAFMVEFDTLFSLHCANPVTLSTAPVEDAAPEPEVTTHWQQSVFYIANPIEVQEGDQIQAKMVAKRMKENPRAYHVRLEWTLVRDGKAGTKYSQEYNVQ